MKNVLKLFIVVVMLGLSVNSFAQATFGVKAGLNLSNMLWKDNDFNYSEEMNFTIKPGFHFGPTLELPINETVSFETALLLSTLGTKAEFSIGEETTKGSVNLLYLNLPLTAKAQFEISGIQLFGAFGPYVGYGLSGKFKAEGESDEDINWGSGDDDDFKPFDAGLHFGVGVGIQAFEIGLTYDLGLTNIAIDTENGYKELNRLLAISLGYKFGKK